MLEMIVISIAISFFVDATELRNSIGRGIFFMHRKISR